ncbi:unnamed protein product, partial [Prorocentrum cordatum]
RRRRKEGGGGGGRGGGGGQSAGQAERGTVHKDWGLNSVRRRRAARKAAASRKRPERRPRHAPPRGTRGKGQKAPRVIRSAGGHLRDDPHPSPCKEAATSRKRHGHNAWVVPHLRGARVPHRVAVRAEPASIHAEPAADTRT